MLWFMLSLTLLCPWAGNVALGSQTVVLPVRLIISPNSQYRCQDLSNMIEVIADFAVTVTCVASIEEHEKIGFIYELRLFPQDNQFVLQVKNLQRQSDLDFEVLSWSTQKLDRKKLQSGLLSLLSFLRDNYFNSEVLKDSLLRKDYDYAKYLREEYTLDESWVFIKNQDSHAQYEDARLLWDIQDGSEIKRKKNFLRTTWEIAGLLGLGQMLYYVFDDASQADWDYTAEDFLERLTTWQHWKMDDNRRSFNVTHVYSGSLPYIIGRSNGLTTFESFLATVIFSSIWEIGAEFREVIAINDQIVTTMGGAAIGETLYQMGQVLRQRPGVVEQVFATVLDPMGTLNYWLDGRAHPYSDRSLRAEQQAAFTAHIGYTLTKGEDSHGHGASQPHLLTFGVRGLVSNAGVNVPGTNQKWLNGTLLSQLLVQAKFSPESFEEFYALSRNILAGYYKKNITIDDNSQLHGYSLLVGPANGIEYRSRQKGEETDWYGVFNAIGVSFEFNFFHNGYHMHSSTDIFGNFALIRPFALDAQVVSETDLQRISSVMAHDQYNYAAGYTINQEFTSSKNGWQVGALVRYTEFYGLNYRNLDRFAERIIKEADVKDSALNMKLWVEKRISKRSKVRTEIEVVSREGRMQWWVDGLQKKALQDEDWTPSFMLTFEQEIL
jgi:Domain of unknown function (DUF3943)